MKPSDHPEFFRFPAPEGRSRESTIVLDRAGAFSHDGEPVAHAKLAQAMHGWLSRHPDDGRYILTNGYDWTYLTVEGAPCFVDAVDEDAGQLVLTLRDGAREPLDPSTLALDEEGALTTRVKPGAPGGPYPARFSRFAQTALAPWLEEQDGVPHLRVGGALHRLPDPARPARAP